MNEYHTAAVCENGHAASKNISRHDGGLHCEDCGAAIISNCPSCHAPIRGEIVSEFFIGSDYTVPKFCKVCGKPYPWTRKALELMKAIIEEDENQSEDEHSKLISSLPDIISETPGTNIAVIRTKKFFASAGKFCAEGLRDVIVDIGSEAIKKALNF